MVKVKICGITNLEDALAAACLKADALGFVFYRKSPRYIKPEAAARIIRKLPPSVFKIGVFVNEREKTVKRIARECSLDLLQFHGSETPEFLKRFKGYKVIKAVRVKDKIDPRLLARYRPFAFLFDTFDPAQAGGTGRKFDWRLSRHISDVKSPVFLSGGLNEKNVKEAIRRFRPAWVDASSSLELSPGRKCHKKLKRFISAAKHGGDVP